jgi:hypothetical protein
MATRLRLPDEVEEHLDAYCAAVGASKNRVTALALRSYLGLPVPALPVARDFDPAPQSAEESGYEERV